MSDKEIAIKAENITKTFLIEGGLREKNLASLFAKKRRFRGMNQSERIRDGKFYALDDVNLEVYKGETLGIIGSNGAGKTTLLKILSKILKQSSGTYTINGRVSSLIGVGTGFHQELTGRENVYFNGVLLGMTKKEISQRFEEIVEFAEVGSFIDSPVKFYSSGMRSRLAFSVAMNLDAEIMIIDEALAVGDTAFRQKSTEKMRNTAFTGRTVLFVSHSMSFMQEVCTRSILLDQGKLATEGPTTDVIDAYLHSSIPDIGTSWKSDPKTKIGDNILRIESMKLLVNDTPSKKKTLGDDETAAVEMHLHSEEKTGIYSVGYSLFDESRQKIWNSRLPNVALKKGKNTLVAELPVNILRPGLYYVAADIEKRGEQHTVAPDRTPAQIMFNVTTQRTDLFEARSEGLIKPISSWHQQ